MLPAVTSAYTLLGINCAGDQQKSDANRQAINAVAMSQGMYKA